jgi:HSP20 family molecular chaperone IbpA
MIFIRPASSQHHPYSGPEVYRHPACTKASYSACCNDEKPKSETLPKNQVKKDELKSDSTSSPSESRVFIERAPIHFNENDEAATIALDVAGFSPQDIQVRVEDFIVSIDAKRVNKLGDTYVIRRRFRVDKATVVEDMVRANLTDHILEVVVPKKAKVGPRSIPISTTATVTSSKKMAEGKEETKATDKSETNHQSSKEEEEVVSSAPALVDVTTENEQKDASNRDSIKVEVAQSGTVEEESWEDVKDE